MGFIVQFKFGMVATPQQLQQLEDLRSALWGPDFSYGHSGSHHPSYHVFTYIAKMLGTISEEGRLKTQPEKAQKKTQSELLKFIRLILYRASMHRPGAFKII